jgi:hypothetical protein
VENDRELLEAAAKAAGIEAHWGHGWQSDMMFTRCVDLTGVATGREWNPLKDDGDALRLAVKLGIQITQEIPASSRFVPKATAYYREHFSETYGSNPFSATRRAIVRAAANIGKG